MAVGGIGLSLYAGMLTVDDIRDRASSEHDIAAACDHLVSGAQVMDLQGGMVRAKSSDYDEYRLDARHRSACTIYKVSGSHKTTDLFRLIVASSDDSEPVNVIGDRGSPFLTTTDGHQPKDDVTAVADREPEAWPLGDGTLGSYMNFRTTIRAECGPGSGKAAPRLLNVTAVARYQEVPAEDLLRLAHIARSATQQLTRRIGCRTQLPALPDRMPAVPSKLRPAASATGSCRWADRLVKEQRQGLAARPRSDDPRPRDEPRRRLPAGGQPRPGPSHRRRSGRRSARLRRRRAHALTLVATHGVLLRCRGRVRGLRRLRRRRDP